MGIVGPLLHPPGLAQRSGVPNAGSMGVDRSNICTWDQFPLLPILIGLAAAKYSVNRCCQNLQRDFGQGVALLFGASEEPVEKFLGWMLIGPRHNAIHKEKAQLVSANGEGTRMASHVCLGIVVETMKILGGVLSIALNGVGQVLPACKQVFQMNGDKFVNDTLNEFGGHK